MIFVFLASLFSATPIVSTGPPDGLTAADLYAIRNHEIGEVREAIALCRDGRFEKAMPVIRKYADQRDVGATYILAKLYEKGLGVAPDPEKAAALFDANVTANHAPSMIALGELKEEKSPTEALGLFRQASALDDPIAHLKLGDIYERGILGAKADPKLAFSHFEKLGKTNLPDGFFRLARCYDAGIGVSPDATQATRLFRKAALGGHVPSQVIMARRYFEGKGLDQDPVAATGWLTRASQSGSAEAQILLGLRYENGDATGKDFNMAGQLYAAAAAQDEPAGRFHLARLYANGLGTKPDLIRAYVLLSRAQKFPPAKEALAKLESTLTPGQLDLAKKKLAEVLDKAKGKTP